MRYFGRSIMAVAVCFWTCLCTPAPLPNDPGESPMTEIHSGDNSHPQNNNDETEFMTIKISAGGKTFTAQIEETETGKAFMAKLPLTLDMSELNGNEKYCYGVELPRADKRYDSIEAGDLMLFSGNCVVLFYGSAGGYSYTRIGRLQSTEGLASALGSGSVSVRFE